MEMIELISSIFFRLNIPLNNYSSIAKLIMLWSERMARVNLTHPVDGEEKREVNIQKSSAINGYFSNKFSGILFPPSNTPKSFLGMIDGQSRSFHFEGVKPDGNCGFRALDITRDQLADLLQIHAEDLAVRSRLREPMLENLKTPEHPLFRCVKEKEEALRVSNSEAGENIQDFPEFPELNDLKMRSHGRVQWLRNNGHNETAQTIEQKLNELQQAEILFEEYLQSPTAFESYITGLRNNLWIDTESIRFYAEKHQWTVRIWMQEQGTLCLNRDLHAGHEEVNAVQTHDILFNGTHYDRLVLQQTPENHEQARATMVTSVSI